MKLSVERHATSEAAAHAVAEEIAAAIRAKPDAVLGLPTGATPRPLYAELVRMHREDGLNFSRVRAFLLDEYVGLPKNAPQSFQRYMHEHLFRHVNIDPRNIHVLPSDVAAYESALAEAGGLDVVVLGIGENGHIAFNEPGAARESRTRLVQLSAQTRENAAAAFSGLDKTPQEALTLGVANLLSARQVVLLATGARKATIVQHAVEGPVSADVPASFLQDCPVATVVVDAEAGALLNRR